MKKWFTADWHLGEDRIGINGKPNLFYRPFKAMDVGGKPIDVVGVQNLKILVNFKNSGFKNGDELYHMGDVVYDWQYDSTSGAHSILDMLKKMFPKSKFHLIIGNYDEDKVEELGEYFDNIVDSAELQIGNFNCYLNHYPVQCKRQLDVGPIYDFAITGHIHGLWKVQKNMINVGVDAWHFKPVSEDEILFCWNAMQKFYDENVFPYN